MLLIYFLSFSISDNFLYFFKVSISYILSMHIVKNKLKVMYNLTIINYFKILNL